jgi:hypothetical protein
LKFQREFIFSKLGKQKLNYFEWNLKIQHPFIELCELKANLGEMSTKLRFDLFKLYKTLTIQDAYDRGNESSKTMSIIIFGSFIKLANPYFPL